MSRTSLDVSRELVTYAKERRQNPSDIWGIPWGMRGIDRLTGGIQTKELSILGARPSVGKSALAGQLALNVARWVRVNRPGEVVRVVHVEMSRQQFQLRLACLISGISPKRIHTGGIRDEQEYKQFTAALRELAELPIEIEDEPTSFAHVRDFIEGTGSEQPTAWWMCDYLQIVPIGEGRLSAGNMDGIEFLSGRFRELAKRVAPGLVLSQLTRDVDKREDHRPVVADLYGGTFIEANASVILLINRPDIYQKVSEDERNKPKWAELILAKNRNLEVGSVELLFAKGAYTDISHMEEQQDAGH